MHFLLTYGSRYYTSPCTNDKRISITTSKISSAYVALRLDCSDRTSHVSFGQLTRCCFPFGNKFGAQQPRSSGCNSLDRPYK